LPDEFAQEEMTMPASHRIRLPITVSVALFVIVCLAACGSGPEPTATTQPTATPEAPRLQIDDVFFSPPEPFNGWVMITVVGTLPDGCTEIKDIRSSREDDGYHLSIETARPEGAACTQAVVPFREVIRVDTGSIGAGTYRVFVEGQAYTFTFDQDFSVPLTPDQGS
jgi:hypothetical protein